MIYETNWLQLLPSPNLAGLRIFKDVIKCRHRCLLLQQVDILLDLCDGSATPKETDVLFCAEL
jgi:hypothetical protein